MKHNNYLMIKMRMKTMKIDNTFKWNENTTHETINKKFSDC